MKDFFISYNHHDSAWAEWIAWQLEETGYSTVLQAWDFTVGSNFVLEMQRALTEAQRFIAVLSPAYLTSLYAQPEWAAAFAKDPTGKRRLLLPVRIRECALTGLWSQIVYIDLIGLDERAAKDLLINSVAQERSKPATSPTYPQPDDGAKAVLPPFPLTLPPVWNIPSPRNPNFTGREALLEEVWKTLRSGEAVALTAMVGLGGIGKTQLALEYAYSHVNDYEIVWWIHSESKATLATDYAKLAQELKLPDAKTRNIQKMISAVRRGLQYKQDWLLIFDNAQDPTDIEEYVPCTVTGHVLITSRNPNWGSMAKQVEVGVMDQNESVLFLTKRTRQDNKAVIIELADELGHLPLALAQAAAYIEQTSKSAANYLQLFQDKQGEMLRLGNPSIQDKATVATTWEISFKQMRQDSPAGGALMNLISYLAPDQIPLSILKNGSKDLFEPLATIAKDPIGLDKAVASLRRYSLVEVRDELLSVHRLVQTIVRDQLEENEKLKWASVAVRLVEKAFSYRPTNVRDWTENGRLLSHAFSSLQHAGRLNLDREQTWRLLFKMGDYLRETGQYREARSISEDALKVCSELYDVDHPNMGNSCNNLGLILLKIGDFEEARVNFERALKIGEKTLNSNDLNIATRLNNLGAALYELGSVRSAYTHLKRALKIRERVLGSHHQAVANSLSNLSAVLNTLDDLKQARAYLERALKINENIYGPEHGFIASDLRKLGNMLALMGDLTGARTHHERALKLSKQLYGQDHPDVAACLCDLGRLLWDLDEFEQSRVTLERALQISEQVYGPSHPGVADCLMQLGHVTQLLGDPEGARVYFERSLSIQEQFYGVDNVQTAASHNNLGSVLSDLDEFEGARVHLERALKIRENAYGTEHHTLIVDLNNLGLLLSSLDDLEGARAHLERALKISEQSYNEKHPDVAKCLSSLGAILIDMGEFEVAREHLKRALKIFLPTLGKNHRRTVAVKDDLKRIREILQ